MVFQHMRMKTALAAVLAVILVVVLAPRFLRNPLRKTEYLTRIFPTDVSSDETRVAAATHLGTWVVSLETGTTDDVFRGLFEPAWSPTYPDLLAGLHSAKPARHGEPSPADSRVEIHNVRTRKTTRWKRLPAGFWQWSPRGNAIAVGTWPADAVTDGSGQPTEGTFGLALLDVEKNGAFLAEAGFTEIPEMGTPPVPAWQPDSGRVYFGGLTRTGENLFGCLDIPGGEVTILEANALIFRTPSHFKFIDAKRAAAIRATSYERKSLRGRYGVLDIEALDFQPVPGKLYSASGWGGLYQTRSGGPIYHVRNGAIYQLDAERTRFDPLPCSGHVDLSPVHLAASGTLLFARDLKKLMRRRLDTGEETCICYIDAEGALRRDD